MSVALLLSYVTHVTKANLEQQWTILHRALMHQQSRLAQVGLDWLADLLAPCLLCRHRSYTLMQPLQPPWLKTYTATQFL